MAEFEMLLRLAGGIWVEELRQRTIQFHNKVRGIQELFASRGVVGGPLIKTVFDASLEEIRLRAKGACDIVCRVVRETHTRLSLNQLQKLYRDTITNMYQDIDLACRDVLNVCAVSNAQQTGYMRQLGQLEVNAITQQEFELELFCTSPLPTNSGTSVNVSEVRGFVQIGDHATANVTQNFNTADLAGLTNAVKALLSEVQAGTSEQKQTVAPIVIQLNNTLTAQNPEPKKVMGYLEALSTLIQTAGSVPTAWLAVKAAAAMVGIQLP